MPDGWHNPPRDENDRVVATVDGRPVFASDLVSVARAKNLDVRQALEHAIDAEVLAGAARAAGIDINPEDRRVARQFMVHKLLAADFEPHHRPQDFPEARVRTFYQKNIKIFVHPRAVHFNYLLFTKGGQTDRDDRATRAEAEALKRHLDRALAGLSPDEGLAAFSAVAQQDPWREKGVILRTALVDDPAAPFAAEILKLDGPGQLSKVIAKDNGYIVAIVKRIIPARNTSFESGKSSIVTMLYSRWVNESFQSYADRLAATTGVEIVGDNWKALLTKAE